MNQNLKICSFKSLTLKFYNVPLVALTQSILTELKVLSLQIHLAPLTCGKNTN